MTSFSFQLGENNSSSQFADVQDFETLLKNCLMNGSLFEDPLFPASNESLMFSRRPDRYIEWMRPHVSLSILQPKKYFHIIHS